MGLLFGDLVWTPCANILGHNLVCKIAQFSLVQTHPTFLHAQEKNPSFLYSPEIAAQQPLSSFLLRPTIVL